MKASELRIGNCVDYFGDHVIIYSIRKDNTYYLGGMKRVGHVYNTIDAFKPILLDESWFEKFGFEEAGCLSYLCPDWMVRITKDRGNQFRYDTDSHYQGIPLIYVHQLQNLCFALTGKELEIKDLAKQD